MHGTLAKTMGCLFCGVEQNATVRGAEGGSRLEARLELGAPKSLPRLALRHLEMIVHCGEVPRSPSSQPNPATEQ